MSPAPLIRTRSGAAVSPARRFLRRFLRLLTFTIAVLLLAGWLGAPLALVNTTLHPPRFPVAADTRNLPFPVEPVTFRAADGLILHGWFGYTNAAAPVILFGHGYPANREQMIPYAAFLYAAGYNVLLFDWRAWGESEGTLTTFGLHEVDDLRGALDYLQARPDLQNPRFGGLGVSMGAGLMLIGAAQDHRLAAVVGDSTYARLAPMFAQWNSIGLRIWPYRLGFAPLAAPYANLRLDGHLADLDPLRQAPAVSPSALLLVHAEHDSNGLTPVAGARQIFAAAQEPKALWVSPLGDHVSILAANPDAYEQHVRAFFDTYLRGP
jgi:dipeptidyl aminopeptidase/acylaminoacyl peptidase